MSQSTPRDLAMSPADMATRGDMATTAGDMATGPRDMAMGSGDMATGPRDMAMGPVDMAMGPRDMAMGPIDMSMGPIDMSMSVPDMTTGPRDLAMSGGDMATGSRDMAHAFTCRGSDAPGTVYQLVTDSLTLPTGTGAMAYTYDFDGSTKLKNGLKALLGVVALAGLDLQTPINDAVKNGATLVLASLTTTDLMSSTCTGVTVIPAKATAMPPLFDGTDSLEHYPTTPAELFGSLTTGKLQTKASKSLAATEDAVLELQLSIGSMALALPIHGLHLEGNVERVGTVTRIKSGVIHGVIAASDIDTKLVPGIADMVTRLINNDPMSSATKLVIGLFENTAKPASAMKCMMPALCCKTNPATCVILPAEVTGSLIGGFLKPDVQVFDSMGKWSPVASGPTPNGLTVGLGFTAVTATYR